MNKIIRGKVYVLGDDVDTDQIIPAEHLVYSLSDPQEAQQYGRYALSGVPAKEAGLPEGFQPFVPDNQLPSPYTIIVAGENFGCGSSREHAPFALQMAGVKAIIARSFARIFYRNAVDGGFVLPLESLEHLVTQFHTGEEVILDVQQAILQRESDGQTFALRPPGSVLPIIEAGGLFPYARKRGMITEKINH